MPRIPSDTPYADTGAINAIQVPRGASPAEAAYPGQQLQEFGNALTGVGSTLVQIAVDEQNTVNEIAVMNAMNKARATALDLEWNQETGYQSLKGDSALTRPDGISLPDEYGQKLQTSIGEIAAGLGNDRQRQGFNLRADAMVSEFKGRTAAYMSHEFKAHTLSVADGTIKIAANEAQRYWNNEKKVYTNINQVRAAVMSAGKVSGWSAQEKESRMQIATSNVHASVIEAALQAGNASYASRYLAKYNNDITADDALKATGQIDKVMDVQQATAATNWATQQLTPRFQPTDFDRMVNITFKTESGGRQFDKAGNVMTSSAGAIGIAQVMPTTGPEAAKLAGLEWDPKRFKEDADYNAALGRAYLKDQLRIFHNNVPMAWAAYDAGAGRVKTAMKMADIAGNKEAWLSFMPDETKAYVQKNMRAYATGSGAPQAPSEMEMVNVAVERLGPNARPELVRLTRQTAEHQYGLIDKAQKDRDESSVMAAMRELEQNGGRFSSLSIATRSAIPPKEIDNLMSYGSRLAKGDDTTNPALYLKLTDERSLKALTDAQFYRLRGELSQSDFQHFARERQKEIAGKGSDKPDDLNTSAIKQVLDDRIRMLGRDPTPKDGSAESQLIGAMHKTVRDSILNAQTVTGKKMTDAEVEKHIDGLFSKSVSFRNTFLGVDVGGLKSMGLMGMAPGDIPSNVRDQLKKDFAARGIDSPADTDLLGAYWKLKLSQR